MSTPFGKQGFFYQAWAGNEEWERVTVPATECPRIQKKFLAEEKQEMGERWFRQEYCCEFVDADGGRAEAAGGGGGGGDGGAAETALKALERLGYSTAEADDALRQVLAADASAGSADALLRRALHLLTSG